MKYVPLLLALASSPTIAETDHLTIEKEFGPYERLEFRKGNDGKDRATYFFPETTGVIAAINNYTLVLLTGQGTTQTIHTFTYDVKFPTHTEQFFCNYEVAPEEKSRLQDGQGISFKPVRMIIEDTPVGILCLDQLVERAE